MQGTRSPLSATTKQPSVDPTLAVLRRLGKRVTLAIADAISRGVSEHVLEEKLARVVAELGALPPLHDESGVTTRQTKVPSTTPISANDDVKGPLAAGAATDPATLQRTSASMPALVVASTKAKTTLKPRGRHEPAKTFEQRWPALKKPSHSERSRESPQGDAGGGGSKAMLGQPHRTRVTEGVALGKTSSTAKRASVGDLVTQRARTAAHLIGRLREMAIQTGGELNRAQFQQALLETGIIKDVETLALSDVPERIFDQLDANSNGALSLAELETGLRGILSEDSQAAALVDELLAEVRVGMGCVCACRMCNPRAHSHTPCKSNQSVIAQRELDILCALCAQCARALYTRIHPDSPKYCELLRARMKSVAWCMT